jgi:hypothetical protein
MKYLILFFLTITSFVNAQNFKLESSIDAKIGVNAVMLPTRNNVFSQTNSGVLTQEFLEKDMFVGGVFIAGKVNVFKTDYVTASYLGSFNLGWLGTDSYKYWRHGLEASIGVKKVKVFVQDNSLLRRTVGYYFNATGAQAYTEKLSVSTYDSISQVNFGLDFQFDKIRVRLWIMNESYQNSDVPNSPERAVGYGLQIGQEKWNLSAEFIPNHPSYGATFVNENVISSTIESSSPYAQIAFTRILSWNHSWL